MGSEIQRPEALLTQVIEAQGRTPPELRRRVAEGTDVPPKLQGLVDKIHRHAYRVTAEDIASLKSSYDEDSLFELILSASAGAALSRLRAGLLALEGLE